MYNAVNFQAQNTQSSEHPDQETDTRSALGRPCARFKSPPTPRATIACCPTARSPLPGRHFAQTVTEHAPAGADSFGGRRMFLKFVQATPSVALTCSSSLLYHKPRCEDTPFSCLSCGWRASGLQVSVLLSVCVSHSVVSDPATPTDCSQPGSSVHGIFQARILERVAIHF